MDEPELPRAIVTRVLKEALPEAHFGKDAKLAFAKAAAVFILYLTAGANAMAQDSNRSTISSKDVFKALAEMEFDDFLPELQAKCTRHEAAASAKKARDRDSKKAKKAERDAAAAAAAASAAPTGDVADMDADA